MWRPWSKSSSKLSDVVSSSPNHQHIFRCSSFKDIENLCNLDNLLSNTNDHLLSSLNTNSSLKRQPSAPTHTHTHTRRSIFHRVRTANSLLRQWPARSEPPKPQDEPKASPRETRIVVYYTSLRVIRPTFEACRTVMSILRGFQVLLDERDLAMDLGFMSELRELLGLNPNEELTLPRVFIGGRYIGGADEIVRLHEIGELKELVSGVPQKKAGTCDTCGGYRFILCGECSGSHKIYSDKVGFRSCKACNENGLIRCPHCSSHPRCPPTLAPNINSAPLTT